MQTEPGNQPAPQALPDPGQTNAAAPESTRAVKPIAELVTQPDYPKSVQGELVDIGGFTGVVVEVGSHSIRVRSSEGLTRSFNAQRLRTIYGPVERPEPEPRRESAADSAPLSGTRAAPPAVPKRDVITNPDFTKPVRKIAELVECIDYPKCTFGEHVDVGGYAGVVVEIVNRSLKVRSQAETTRSYNADALKKLYGTKG